MSCAAEGGAAGVAYRVVEEVDKEVLLLEPEVAAAPKVVDVAGPRQGGSAGGMDVDQDRQTADPMAPRVPYQPASSFSPAVPPGQPPVASSSVSLPAPGIEQREGPRVIKTIKKLLVEVLCAQHNPVRLTERCDPSIARLLTLLAVRWSSRRRKRPRTTKCGRTSRRSPR